MRESSPDDRHPQGSPASLTVEPQACSDRTKRGGRNKSAAVGPRRMLCPTVTGEADRSAPPRVLANPGFAFQLDRVADVAQDRRDLAAQEDECDDRDDGDEGKNQRVFRETLTLCPGELPTN